MGQLFAFEGPAEALVPVRHALSWVVDPLARRSLLESGALRRVRIAGGTARVELRLADGPLRQMLVEDLERELFDHLQGRWRIEVVVSEPPAPPERAHLLRSVT